MLLERIVEAPGNGVDFPQPGDIIEVHYTCWAYADSSVNRRGRQFATSRDSEAYRASIGKAATELGVCCEIVRVWKYSTADYLRGVGKVIQGWDVLIVQMSLGERSILYVPSTLAYGPLGFPGLIPMNMDLVFEVELLLITAPSIVENDEGEVNGSNFARPTATQWTDSHR